LQATSNSSGEVSAPWPIAFPNSMVASYACEGFAGVLPSNTATVWAVDMNASSSTYVSATVRYVTPSSVAPGGATGIMFGLGY